ncbi:hypothetical protein ACJX0J_024643, partial [Zea mays]
RHPFLLLGDRDTHIVQIHNNNYNKYDIMMFYFSGSINITTNRTCATDLRFSITEHDSEKCILYKHQYDQGFLSPFILKGFYGHISEKYWQNPSFICLTHLL